MDKIFIAVGSTRRPKLNAVWEAVSVFGPTLNDNAQFEVVGVEVPSGVRHTPLSREEMMTGARCRAESLAKIARKKNEPWKFFVGLEGGLDVVADSTDKNLRQVFLEEVGPTSRISMAAAPSAAPVASNFRRLSPRGSSTTVSNSRRPSTFSPARKAFATPREPGES